MTMFSVKTSRIDITTVFRLVALIFVLAVANTMTVVAAEEFVESQKLVKKLDSTTDKIERQLKKKVTDTDALSQWSKQIADVKVEAEQCDIDITAQLEKLELDINQLGKSLRGEPYDVTKKRKVLTEQKRELEKRLASCRLLVIRSDELLQTISTQQKDILAKHLFARGPSLVILVKNNWQQPALWWNSSKAFIKTNSGLEKLSLVDIILLSILFIAGVAIGISIRRKSIHDIKQMTWAESFSSRFYHALSTNFAHYAPQLTAILFVATYLFFVLGKVKPVPFINVLAYGLPVYLSLLAIIRSFLRPFPPAERVIDLPEAVASSFSRRLELLTLLIFIGYLLFATILSQSLPEIALLMARGVFAAVFMLNLMWVVWLVGYLPRLGETLWLRAGLILSLLAILIIEWVGYRNLSLWILRTLIGSLMALGGLWLVHRLLREVYLGLNSGRQAWHQQVRQLFGLKASEQVPGLFWIYAIVTSVTWLGFAWLLLSIWGLSEAALQQISSYTFDGFEIGSLKVIPVRIMLALVVFAVLVSVSGWLKRQLERRWLIHTRMERSLRETIVTISGYTGFIFALLIGLSVAGFAFTNLAIIAGALSVGIGFGLQNIVNNFVSGLILLFERPIKTGDWIVVGNTEGHVKRIKMRSTLIQTFDRADVIVPNSELISSQVTNWMLYDTRGRIRAPIGVAYGTDPQKVKELLLHVAQEHPEVIKTGISPEPQVLFLGFGASSLDFELRCHIRNIDERVRVISDLNFAIDAIFRENGIQIPFPQRDVHIRDWRHGKDTDN